MSKRKLLLTSTGLSSETVAQEFESLVEGLKNQPVAIITTAAEGKEDNRYSQLAKKQLEDMGFTDIDFVDLKRGICYKQMEYFVLRQFCHKTFL